MHTIVALLYKQITYKYVSLLVEEFILCFFLVVHHGNGKKYL